jgi:hypothetical protein
VCATHHTKPNPCQNNKNQYNQQLTIYKWTKNKKGGKGLPPLAEFLSYVLPPNSAFLITGAMSDINPSLTLLASPM